MNVFKQRTATQLSAIAITAGALAAAGCSSSSSSSSPASTSSASAGAAGSTPAAASSTSATATATGFAVKQIVQATTLKHSFQVNGKGAAKSESLSQPDDMVALGGNLYVGFQNGVGSKGEVSTSGNLDSTLLEIKPDGSIVKQWDVTGKIDGMGADTAGGRVIVTVNEDGNSSMYTEAGGTLTHYPYSPSPLPHGGGTDAVSVYNGKILVSASAPGTPGKGPAVFAVTLNAGTKTAAVTSYFAGNATATAVSGGKKVTLLMSDADSNAVVPSSSSAFGGQFMQDSQGDNELIFTASGQSLKVLKLSGSVDDTRWATSASGTLYVSDSSANTVDAVTGPFQPGTAYAAVTPCNANNAPTNCPAPGFPQNYLGTIDLSTGKITAFTVNGPLAPKGMVFVP